MSKSQNSKKTKEKTNQDIKRKETSQKRQKGEKRRQHNYIILLHHRHHPPPSMGRARTPFQQYTPGL